MPPALWLIALPIGLAPVVYILRRVGLGAIVAAIITFLSAWLAANSAAASASTAARRRDQKSPGVCA